MELELKAEPGCAWGAEDVHLWHLAQVRGDTALCELPMRPDAATRPLEQRADIFPERLCPLCRRGYAELLPGGVHTCGGSFGID
ncbi:hypothetical protein [Streptacidiphilus rugosus]|uniref:hypothetical protein n=1 Tax=Streptacidiphilus rugosus TaxID=405783 RepID=UPI00055DB980|nr:hypothetical protein [Streptacidiphilus rugosus]